MASLVEKILTEFGLNKKEVAVYLATLNCGPAFAARIARKAKLNRSTCYVVLEALIKKGLVSKSGPQRKLQFTAESPEGLLSLIREKQTRAKTLEKKFLKILPELESLHNITEDLPKIKFIGGVEGIKWVYEDTLKSLSRGESYWHCNPDFEALVSLLGERYLMRHIRKRVKKGIKSKVIGTKTPWAEREAKRDRFVKRETVFLPKEIKIPSRLHIYADKVAIFSLGGEPTGVVIENKNIAEMIRIFFQALWDKYSN